ncbi:ATP-binding protein [Actinospica robiniae]|uniref:ATP-binding protein n=1 Tax=Actinospica robiniae TaxID=304901 RepID=UPI00042025A3|nr:ATP-binding protein [Actinospica robiniae]
MREERTDGEDGLGRTERAAVFRPAPRLLATLCFSADKDFLMLARATAAHVAGLLDLPPGEANDLRLAVDEACSLFLAGGGANESVGGLALVFAEVGGELRVTVSGPNPVAEPEPDGLSWTLLRALMGEPSWEVEEDIGILTLREPVPLPG